MSDTNQEKESFEKDCFDRKDFAENLCNLIKGQKAYQSRVISIKADFGYGKTYFAKAFKNMIDELQDNTNPCLYCHYIDIWKEDYNHKPLLALLSSLDEFVGNNNFYKTTTKDNFKNKLKGAVKTLSVELLKEGASHIPMIGKATVKSIETVANYKDTSIFKDLNALKKVAGMIERAFAEFKNAKMIIIIDEIDRCHPEYAIEFLETLKHFFDLENLYFILMMNENHLREKVKSKFGYIDFDMWKDKFINLEFELPNARSQEKFLRYLICEKYEIQNEDLTLNTKSEIIVCERDGMFQSDRFRHNNYNLCKYHSYKNEKYNFSSDLIHILEVLNCKPNNRQLESICLHLRIALNILGDKPIVPLVLFGVILNNYFPNLRESAQNLISTQKEKDNDMAYLLSRIFDEINDKNQASSMNFPFHCQGIQMDHLRDNIHAAQFASQGNTV